MKTVYVRAHDIDLFIGGVTEKPLPKAVLGQTFASLFGLQFVNLRRADRFFYTSNIGQPYALTSSNCFNFSLAVNSVAMSVILYT